jgi:hypothetical protein
MPRTIVQVSCQMTLADVGVPIPLRDGFFYTTSPTTSGRDREAK